MRKLYLDLEGQLKVMVQEENTIIYPEEEAAMKWKKARELAEAAELEAKEKAKKRKKLWETTGAAEQPGSKLTNLEM